MVGENWRHLLYFPLGVLPSLFFSLRFFIQWWKSEKKKLSFVDSLFWKLSLTGNCLLATHYFIQFQYVFLLIQTLNALISWRNLNLLEDSPERKLSLKTCLFLTVFTLISVSLMFFLQAYFSYNGSTTKELFFGKFNVNHIGVGWHAFGIFGGFLFAARFWVQWWKAEKRGKSELTNSFWILSIVGSLVALIYFIQIRDFISIFNYSFSLVPYIRNLILLRLSKLKDRSVATS